VAPIRVVIVDDEPLARQRVRRLLRREPDVVVAAEAADGGAAVTAIVREAPDLVFLDVQMPALDGFETLRALPAERRPVVVFVTAFDRYAVQAFEAQALDYLLKPFNEARFRAAFARARAAIDAAAAPYQGRLAALLDELRPGAPAEPVPAEPAHVDRVLVRAEGRTLVVPAGDIDWIETAGNYVRLHAAGRAHLHRETMAALERRLDPSRFVRVHRTALVNVDRVREIQPWFSGDCVLILHGGAKVKLSRGYRRRLEACLGGTLPDPQIPS
jgi:two-component system LytT family response regulator